MNIAELKNIIPIKMMDLLFYFENKSISSCPSDSIMRYGFQNVGHSTLFMRKLVNRYHHDHQHRVDIELSIVNVTHLLIIAKVITSCQSESPSWQ